MKAIDRRLRKLEESFAPRRMRRWGVSRHIVPGCFALAPPVRIAESVHHSSGAFAPEPEPYGLATFPLPCETKAGRREITPGTQWVYAVAPMRQNHLVDDNEFHRRPIHRRHAAEKREKARLSAALRRLPIQCMFKLSRDRRSFDIAGENFTIRCVATVKFPVGFLIRTKSRAFQRDAREQPARTGI
jgi:hypothetical protein